MGRLDMIMMLLLAVAQSHGASDEAGYATDYAKNYYYDYAFGYN